MSRPSWGVLLGRDLAALAPLLALGCDPPRVEPVVPPAPASQAPLPPPPPPLPLIPLGLGPAVDLFPSTPEPSTRYLQTETIPFGRGVLVVERWHGWEREFIPRCPVKEPETRGCEAMALAASKSPTQEASFPRWESAPTEAWSAPKALARSWTQFSGGKQGVYAFARGEQKKGFVSLDLIDERGQTGFFEAELTEDQEHLFASAAILETPAGRRILGQRTVPKKKGKSRGGAPDWDDEVSLVFASIEDRGGKSRVVRAKPLKIWPMSREEGTAHYARTASARGSRVAYGPWHVVPALDAQGKPDRSVFLVWTEVLPPPKIDRQTPRTDPPPAAAQGAWQRTPAHEAWMGAMGCGAPSRKLSELSARKQMHVTRLSLAGDTLQDAVVPFPAGFDPAVTPLPLVTALPGGLQVGSLLLDPKLQPTTALAPASVPAVTPPPAVAQGLVQAAFDSAIQEGIVIIQQGEKHLVRRFDPLGQPIGEAEVYAGDLLLDRRAAVLGRGPGSWVALGGSEHRVNGRIYPIKPGREPLFLPGAKAEGWSYWPTAGWGDSFAFKGFAHSIHGQLGVVAEGLAGERRIALIDPEAGKVAEPIPFATSSRNPQRLPGWVEGEHGFLVLDEMTVHDEEGAHPLPEEATSLAGRSAETSFHRVWNDVVMVRQSRAAISGTWLRQGVTRHLTQAEALRAEAAHSRRSHLNRRDDIGPFDPPLLLDGRALLPATPGDVIASEALVPLRDDCPFIVPTDPGRLVLVCVEIRGAGAPASAVTLRTFRFDPPAPPAGG